MQLFHVFLDFFHSFLHCNLPFVMFLLLFTSWESSTIHWKCKYCSCRWVNKKASSRVDDIDYLWKYVLRTLQKRLSKGKLKHIFWLFRSHVTFLGGLNINLWGVCCEKKNFHLKLIKKQRKKWFPAVKLILSKNKTREMKNIFPLHSFDIKRDAFAW